jgi:hypothetical protein
MNGLNTDIRLLKQRTYRKIAQLAKELDMKRSRLERFVAGQLAKSDLTVAEYETLSLHPIFSDLLDRPDDEGRKKFTIANAVTYKHDLREKAMELLGRYILPPFLSVAHSSVREPVMSRDYDLRFTFQTNVLQTHERDASVNSTMLSACPDGRIKFDPEDARIFHDYLHQLAQEDNLTGDDVLGDYFMCYDNCEQFLWRNIVCGAAQFPSSQLKLDFSVHEGNGY